MQIKHNVSLKDYSTMHLGGEATAATEVKSLDELKEALTWARENKLKTLILGGGSNVVFGSGYDGLIIVNKILGFDILSQDHDHTTIKVGAGENWDGVVAHSVELGLQGIEALSAIPGSAGATPVQNVGAYGQEIADTLIELQAYDQQTDKVLTMQKSDCGFGYRRSIFKTPAGKRYVILNITLRLNKKDPTPPFYPSLERYLTQAGITHYTVKNIRDSVIAVRANVLPDPTRIPNNGSFFKNALVKKEVAEDLKTKWPDMPQYPMNDGTVKIPAGWLIDNTGLKGYKAHGLKTYENNALVIVNESARDASDLTKFKQEIIDKVYDKFGVRLEQEPELIG